MLSILSKCIYSRYLVCLLKFKTNPFDTIQLFFAMVCKCTCDFDTISLIFFVVFPHFCAPILWKYIDSDTLCVQLL